MTDDANQKYEAQRNQEPRAVDSTITGNHLTGNYFPGQLPNQGQLPSIGAAVEIWIEQKDHAKQGMARKFDLKGAQAAPGHPHIGHVEGSGEIQ
jgi:hypothetical protein